MVEQHSAVINVLNIIMFFYSVVYKLCSNIINPSCFVPAVWVDKSRNDKKLSEPVRDPFIAVLYARSDKGTVKNYVTHFKNR